MKEPFLSDEAFLADVDAARKRAGILDLWWLGQSGFLIHHRERWVLVDPYLSDSLTAKYAKTDKPHVRMTRRVVGPVELVKRIGVPVTITASHAHTDHLDPDTLKPIASLANKFIVPRSSIDLARDRSDVSTPAHPVIYETTDDNSVNQIGGAAVRITAIPSAHETIERDDNGNCKFLGYVFEFYSTFVSARAGGANTMIGKEWTVYHSGDTVLYDGLVEKLRPFKIDIALLPINGRAPERRVAGNLTGPEAAGLAKKIKAKLVIPCHYDMFEFNTASPDEFVAECQRLKQPYRVLRQGERFSTSEMPTRTHHRGTENTENAPG